LVNQTNITLDIYKCKELMNIMFRICSQSSLEEDNSYTACPSPEYISSVSSLVVDDSAVPPVTPRRQTVLSTSRIPRKRVLSTQAALHEA